MGIVIWYNEPGSANGGVSWTSGVMGEIERSSLNVDMGLRRLSWWVPTTAVGSKSRTCWGLNNSTGPQGRLETTRAERMAATLTRLPKSGADRDGDPRVGYGARRECKFDLSIRRTREPSSREARSRTVSAAGIPEVHRYVPFSGARRTRHGRPVLAHSAELHLARNTKISIGAGMKRWADSR